jgi:translocation and assembly module TamA
VLCLCCPSLTAAEPPALKYKIEGVSGELLRNIQSWLGENPRSVRERRNFLFSWRDRTEKSLRALGYYRPHIHTELQRTEPSWQFRIIVDPGEPVLLSDVAIEVVGDGTTDEVITALVAEAPLVEGAVLHHGAYEGFKRDLLGLARDRGYFDARFARSGVEVDAAASEARVALQLASGQRYRFGEVLGSYPHLDPAVLQSLRTFEPGDPFDVRQLQRYQGDLQQSRYFASAIVRPALEASEEGVVPVETRLEPASRHSFEVGVGFSTDTQERASLTWRTPRVNRYGHSQETRLEYSSVNPSARVGYNIPLSHPLRDFLQLGYRLEDNEFGDLESRQRELQVRRETASGRWVRSLSLRSLNEGWNLAGTDFSNDYLLPGISWSHKTRHGPVLDPEAGFSQFYRIEGGAEAMGSDLDLVRVRGRWGWITSPLPRQRLVVRGELGAVFLDEGQRSNLAPSLSFFAGGSNSLRGFAYQSIGQEIPVIDSAGDTQVLVIGGERLALASVEYQYYWSDQWRTALFVDGGDAFDEGDFEAHYGAGFGLHYLSPVGALRVELANSLSEKDPAWRFHITVGAEF